MINQSILQDKNFYCEIESNEILKQILNIFVHIADHVRISFNIDETSSWIDFFRMADDNKAVFYMTTRDIPLLNFFCNYNDNKYNNKTKCTIDVNPATFYKGLKMIKHNEKIALYINKRVGVICDDCDNYYDNYWSYNLTLCSWMIFNVRLLDIHTRAFDLNLLCGTTHINMKYSNFKKIFLNICNSGEYIKIRHTTNKIIFSNLDNAKEHIFKLDEYEVNNEVNNEVIENIYLHENLVKINKCIIDTCTDVILQFEFKKPFIITYKLYHNTEFKVGIINEYPKLK